MLQVIFMPLNCHPVRQLPRTEVERPLEGLLEGPLLRDAGPAPRALQAHIHLRRGQEKRERYVGKIMLGLGFEIELLGLMVDSERNILPEIDRSVILPELLRHYRAGSPAGAEAK